MKMIAGKTVAPTRSVARRRGRAKGGVVAFDSADSAANPAAPKAWVYTFNAAARGERLLAAAYRHREVNTPALPPIAAFVVEAQERELQPLGGRPQGRKMLRLMRRGDHLLLSLADLGRSRKDWIRQIAALLHRGFTLHVLDDPSRPLTLKGELDLPTRRKLAALIDQVAEEAKSRRTKATLRKLRDERRPFSSDAPFGMTIMRLADGRKVLAASRADRLWGRRILAWRKSGWPRAKIVRELRRRKAKSSSGGPWTLRKVERTIWIVRRKKPAWAE